MISRLIVGMAAVAMIHGVGATVAWAEPPKTTTEQDIVYTKAGSVELKLDLARPAEGDGPFPAVIVIHGGAGGRETRPMCDQFCRSLPGGDTSRSHHSTAFAPRTHFRPRFTT